MAEAFLQVILENLSSLIKEEVGLIMGVDDEMKKLSSTLTTIQAVLEDAEFKQVESKPIRDWLRKVNAIAYEIDDILDECNTHVSKLNHSAGGKLSRYSLQKILYRRKIGSKMKKVRETLDSVAAERAKFNLREMPVDRPREVATAASRETGSLLNEPDTIYGRDEDRDRIVKLLMEDAMHKKEVSVLPIMGIGGLGKTILAQLAFNDPHVVDHFDAGKLSRHILQKILYWRKIGRRMKKVPKTLNSFAVEQTKFHLREMPVDRPRVFATAASLEMGSLLNEPDTIYRRDEDRDMIVKLLVEDAVDKQEVSVLPIIGVGGLGKTTLAQLVFNDPRVADHFKTRIWVCVSDDFDIMILLRAMIESATGSSEYSELQSLDALECRINELLSQKRYLLVLDDVWNDNQHKWFELKSILSCGSTGSSIIVTTRQRKVADIMRTLPSHCLEGLSDEHCWMLLKQRAFGLGQHEEEEEEEKYPELVRIGKQIVKKCAGVPLAAKALGGILRFKRKEEEWIYVRESEIWKLSEVESLIIPALMLSYHHLPLELRQCFAYFAAFPKDYQVEKEELITLWMAHGFITSRGTLQAEEVGNEICNELLHRSLFEGSFTSNKIGMHDLVHDLAESIMNNKVPGLPINRSVPGGSTVREVNLLHRYVMFPKTFQQDIEISSVMELTSLRVLDASLTTIKELPPSIGNLIHLRYLNLSNSEICNLPNSLCSLWNLQMLNLDDCLGLVALPNNMRYLRNLQHLCLEYCLSLSKMPSRMRELTRLKTLSTFVVGFNRSNQLEELERLNLSGSLQLRHLERVKHHLDAKKANLTEKKNLRKLGLSWERNNLSKLGEDVDEEVLEALEPPSNLEVLRIDGFRGRCFPFWMTNSTLGKVVRISIVHCENCTRLPKLGDLPHLKELVLRNVGVEYVIEAEEVESGKLISTQFPTLQSLSLFDLPNLRGLSKEQEINESFPNLRQLLINGCPLFVLPPLSFLQKLENLECGNSTLPVFSEVITRDTLKVKKEEKVTTYPMETLDVASTSKQNTMIEEEEEIPDSPDTELSGDGDATEETNNKAKSEVYVDKVLDIERFLKYFMSFCSLLPRYYEFSKDILVSQWMTGGLIELGEYKTAEEVCAKCFDTLVEMDYFVPSEYDYIFDRMKYKIGDGIKFDSKMINTSVVEHTSVSFKDLGVLKQYSCLQTLVIYDSYGVDHLPSDIFSELKSLNILNLSGTNVAALPSSIENLKELRLLDMSKTPIRWLPNTICYFSHLQTLNLDGCLELEHLPRCMNKLTNLQHLVLDMSRLQSIPIGMGNLSKLQTLNMFSVGMDEGRRVTELKDLNELRGSFSLSNLENVRSKDEASEACLHKKAGLRKIELHWSDVQDEKCESEEGILESLQPPLITRELKILFYSGGVLPSWICNPSFSELVSIVLDACKYCSSLPSLGELPSLKSLTIIENNVLTEIGSSFFRFQPNPYHPYHEAFPKLEKLSFESMFKLEKWTGFEDGDFPSLRLLIIEYCPVFVGTPFLSRLSSLSGLEIRYCPEFSCLPEDGLPASLESLMIKQSLKLKAQCCDEQWKDWSKVALVSSIYIDDQEFSPRNGEPVTS